MRTCLECHFVFSAGFVGLDGCRCAKLLQTKVDDESADPGTDGFVAVSDQCCTLRPRPEPGLPGRPCAVVERGFLQVDEGEGKSLLAAMILDSPFCDFAVLAEELIDQAYSGYTVSIDTIGQIGQAATAAGPIVRRFCAAFLTPLLAPKPAGLQVLTVL